MPAPELCFLAATGLAALIRERKVSAVELMQVHVSQIERVSPQVNAIVTFRPEHAVERARATDAGQARREPLHLLHGLPTAQVLPFHVEVPWVREVDGKPMADYLD